MLQIPKMEQPSSHAISQFVSMFRQHHPEHIIQHSGHGGLEVIITDCPPNQTAMTSYTATWDPALAAYVVTLSSAEDDLFEKVVAHLGLTLSPAPPIAKYHLQAGQWIRTAVNL